MLFSFQIHNPEQKKASDSGGKESNKEENSPQCVVTSHGKPLYLEREF